MITGADYNEIIIQITLLKRNRNLQSNLISNISVNLNTLISTHENKFLPGERRFDFRFSTMRRSFLELQQNFNTNIETRDAITFVRQINSLIERENDVSIASWLGSSAADDVEEITPEFAEVSKAAGFNIDSFV